MPKVMGSGGTPAFQQRRTDDKGRQQEKVVLVHFNTSIIRQRKTDRAAVASAGASSGLVQAGF